MTYAHLDDDERAALRWLIRTTLWYGHGHHRTVPTSPALLLLALAGLAEPGPTPGTWAATPAAFTLWRDRQPRPFWKDAA